MAEQGQDEYSLKTVIVTPNYVDPKDIPGDVVEITLSKIRKLRALVTDNAVIVSTGTVADDVFDFMGSVTKEYGDTLPECSTDGCWHGAHTHMNGIGPCFVMGCTCKGYHPKPRYTTIDIVLPE